MFEILIADKKIDFAKLEVDIAYIIAKNGIMIFRRTEQFESLSEVQNIPTLKELDGYCKIRNLRKIPSYLLARALSFFQVVYSKHSSEAGLLIIYNRKTKKFDLLAPPQEVSGASLDWKIDRVPFKKNVCVAGTIHSHADFGAFHSGTDDGDESDVDGIHITFGKVNSEPEIVCSYMAGGQRVKLQQKDIAYNCKGSEKFPADWLANVKKKSYGFTGAVQGYGGSYGGYDGCYDDYPRGGNGLVVINNEQLDFNRTTSVNCAECQVQLDGQTCRRCENYNSSEYYNKKYPKTSTIVSTEGHPNITECTPQGCQFFPPSKECGRNACKHYKGRKWRREKIKWWQRFLRVGGGKICND